jgi:hypothetical protein
MSVASDCNQCDDMRSGAFVRFAEDKAAHIFTPRLGAWADEE